MLIIDLFFYLKAIYNRFFLAEQLTVAQKLKIINAKLDALYEKKPNRYLTEGDSCIADGELFEGEGTVTHLNSSHGYINENIYFSREMAKNLQIQVGSTVTYIARRICDGSPVIYAIKSIYYDSWESAENSETAPTKHRFTKINTHEKWLYGTVIGAECGQFLIKTNDQKTLDIDLKRIDCTFLPMIGDEVKLLAILEEDRSSQDCSGVIIEMCRLVPTRKIMYTGKIDCFPKDGKYGTIDREYIFFMDALRHSDNLDRKIDVGDRVCAEAIACSIQLSNYKKYGWRCIKIIKSIESKDENEAAMLLSTEPDEIDDNEHGISICKSTDLSVLFYGKITLGETKELQIIVQNNSDNDHQITGVAFKYQNTGDQVACDQFAESQTVPSQSAFTYTVNVTSRKYGVSYERIVFSFDNGLEIERSIKIDVAPGTRESTDAAETSRNITKFTKEYTKSLYKRNIEIQPGVRVREAPHFVVRRLKPFEVPQTLLDAVLETTSELNISVKLADILPSFSPLEFTNYKRCFQALLHLEEIALDHEFRKYDRSCAHFTRENTADGQYLVLRVENVMESRPSIIVGDRVYAQSLLTDIGHTGSSSQHKHNEIQYEGFIHKIKQNRLLIKFSENFHQRYNGEDYRIYFKFGRSQFIKQHNAIDMVSEPKILFPSRIHESDVQYDVSITPGGELFWNYRKRTLQWFNTNLNIIQKKAVQKILRGETRPMPYIVFGPPGTGKTSTVVELILQLFKRVGGSRIIVCAPSNSAANIIAKRIIESKVLALGEFIRIVSRSSIERELIPDDLMPYCALTDIAMPDTTENKTIRTKSGLQLNVNSVTLGEVRLLISTCSSFGSLMHMKFRSPFTHVIIDEAGQCLESEAMVPISLLKQSSGQIVLAGDPMQLGPIVMSRLAKDRGLDKSLLVRLLDRIPYTKFCENSYDCRTVTKLLYNYRALPSVLSAYNKLFYENELIATISEVDSDEKRLLSKVQANIRQLLPTVQASQRMNENFGVFFCGVRGREEQVPESSSWCNRSEMRSVFFAVNGLIRMGVRYTDIGIITPYSLQVKEIRELLEAELNEEMPKIGSVEEFQGQERKVIVISTVRSNVSSIETDTKYNLGFVKNVKRMNVAISRARAVLMVFGNPDVLLGDSDWRQLISDCLANGTYFGCNLPVGFERNSA